MATDDGPLYQPLLDELAEFKKRIHDGPNLRGHETEAIRTLRHALRTWELEHATVDYLSVTSTEFTRPLVDDLVTLARADRANQAVQQLLGRLTYQEQVELVPPAVFKILDAESTPASPVDYMDWRRMADLLYNLGLFDALRDLYDKARDSIDGDIREVAEDFGDV